jgi:hypothetical protein
MPKINTAYIPTSSRDRRAPVFAARPSRSHATVPKGPEVRQDKNETAGSLSADVGVCDNPDIVHYPTPQIAALAPILTFALSNLTA